MGFVGLVTDHFSTKRDVLFSIANLQKKSKRYVVRSGMRDCKRFIASKLP